MCILDLRDNPVFRDEAGGNSSERNFAYLTTKRDSTLIQLNGLDLVEAMPSTNNEQRGDDEEEAAAAAAMDRMRANIVERSRVRHQNDRICMEREWEQRRLALDSIKTSINEKFKTRPPTK